MKYNEHDVIRISEESEVGFAELLFTNVFGELMSLTVPASQLADIFRSGFCFDASRIRGFMGVSDTDLVLRPSPESMTIGADGKLMQLFCGVTRPDGTPFEGDGRYFLTAAVERAKKLGFDFRVGMTGEFYLFKLDNRGKPMKTPVDTAGRFGTSPADCGGELRREVSAILEQEDITVRAAYHGDGPGQNVVRIRSLPPVTAADTYMLFMRETKAAASRKGMFASFMPKPLTEEKGSSLEIRLRCKERGEDIFRQTEGRVTGLAGKMIGGLIQSLPAMTFFLNSTTNSYTRLCGENLLDRAAWTRVNADAAMRLRSVHDGSGELVLRSPDSTGNFYYSLGLLINACIEGVNRGATAPRAIKADGTYLSGCEKLPATLTEALKAAEKDGFIRSVTDTAMLAYLIEEKRKLCRDYEEARDKESFEAIKYFAVL